MHAAVSLVEVLVAALVLSVVGTALYSSMTATVRTAGLDRSDEARRQVLHDLLERYAQDFSDLASLWPPGAAAPFTRTLTVDEALEATGNLPATSTTLKASLSTGQVTGFTLAYSPAISIAAGDPARAVRLDRLYAMTELAPEARGPAVVSFRLFVGRSRP